MMMRIEKGPWSGTYYQCLGALGLDPLRMKRLPKGTKYWFTSRGWKRFGIPCLHYLMDRGYNPEVVAENIPKERIVSTDGMQALVTEAL